jgi:hypothetical protein
MDKHERGENTRDAERRALLGEKVLVGMPVRDGDIEQAMGLHWVAKLFRGLSLLLVALAAVQVFNGMTSTVDISIGVLAAEAIRLVIFAALLWGAGSLADLFVTSHHDLRAMRIMLGRLTHLVGQQQALEEPRSGDDSRRGRGDATH